MFSKSRINDQAPRAEAPRAPEPQTQASSAVMPPRPSMDLGAGSAAKPKAAASVLSSDLTVTGNLRTTGDIVVEGIVDGDIRAHLLTVGESATIRGEIVADDIVINGRVIGRVRGLKVRLTSTARVEGDIIHKTIAIESGAHFEGSVQRQDDPISGASQGARPQAQAQPQQAPRSPAPAAPAAPQPAPVAEQKPAEARPTK
jgi:cytoskeletal protein CcmA (bactofilin family)